MLRKSSNPSWSLLLLIWLLAANSAFGQGTAFTYQGKLTEGSSPANSTYDFEFKLFDTAALGTGTQFGTTQMLTSVAVSGGIFTAQLDFGACPACFNGTARFLEISVKPAGSGTFTTLGPRQPLSSTPYAIRSLNAAVADGLSVACANCITSSQIASVSGGAVTGTIPVASVPAGSASYIQNTTNQQASSNFNISGNGTAGGTLSGSIVNAAQQFDLGGQRLLSAPSDTYNLFAGISAGANTTGVFNAFFGHEAGAATTSGYSNSFFGTQAGYSSTGNENAFFGTVAGSNSTGNENAFFGYGAGNNNTAGSGNAFFGRFAGLLHTAGNNNTIVGSNAGLSNRADSDNTFVGASSNGAAGISNATAIGSRAAVSQSNSLVLGSISGVNGATADTNVGIGITGPAFKLHVIDGSNTGLRVQTDSDGGTVASFGGKGDFQIDAPGIAGGRFVVKEDGRVGIGTTSPAPSTALHVQGGFGYGVRGSSETSAGVYGDSSNGIGVYGVSNVYAGFFSGHVHVSGVLSVGTLESAGTTALCRNASNQIAFCSSSLRYKTDVGPFSGGLEILNRLRPIAFTWKQGGSRDIGLAAEEVEQVEPLLVTHNPNGEVEGVKYDRLNVVLVNAMQQQQRAIESLQHENAELKARLAALEQVVQQIKDQQAMILKASR